MYPVSDQWKTTVKVTHRIYNQVQVFDDRNVQIGSLPFTAGSVSEQWVSGIRRSINITVVPTAAAKQMLQPGVELRPFSGINYGYGAPEIVPMGRFPLFENDLSIQADQPISLTCNDRWQWMAMSPFPQPRPSNVGMLIQDQAMLLITETGRWTRDQITCTVTSAIKVGAQVFDGDRHTTIVALLDTIGAEVFTDRLGNPVIQTRPALGAPVAAFAQTVVGADGVPVFGRLKDLSVATSATDVYAVVIGTSTSTDPAIPPLTWTARITDPTHPAYPPPGVQPRTFPFNSPQFTDITQLKNATEKMLSRVSRQARQLSIVAAATDPSLDASDTITVTWPTTGLSENLQLQSVDHALVLAGSDAQPLTTVSNRTDEDFTP